MWMWEAVLLEHIVQLQIPLWSQSLIVSTMPTGLGPVSRACTEASGAVALAG